MNPVCSSDSVHYSDTAAARIANKANHFAHFQLSVSSHKQHACQDNKQSSCYQQNTCYSINKWFQMKPKATQPMQFTINIQ